MFGECELGDMRRTERLVSVAARMSKQMGCSLSKSCQGDSAALLGSYRLLRNDDVTPKPFGRAASPAWRSTRKSMPYCWLWKTPPA